MRTKIDNFFNKKGIAVYYNALGATEPLIKSFLSNYKEDIDKTSFKVSSEIKNVIYNKIFPITFRHKKTGFEAVKNLDNKFRDSIKTSIIEPQFSPILLVENQKCDSQVNYKENLIDFVKTIKNPLIYFSGGIDSELLLKACISATVNFEVVIFEWFNSDGELLNNYELGYAYAFCKQHNISPIVKQINIEKLWVDKTFVEFAINLQIQSPQLATHAYMIDSMSKEYVDFTHMFGGEIKFKKNYLMDNGTIANLVYLDKLNPGYNGVTYGVSDDGGGFGVQVTIGLNYNSNGSWVVQASGGNQTGSPTSGSWTDTPSSTYEFRITNVNNIQGSPEPSGPTGWFTIAGGTNICTCTAASQGPGDFGNTDAIFDIEVRVVGQTVPLQSSSIRLVASAFN